MKQTPTRTIDGFLAKPAPQAADYRNDPRPVSQLTQKPAGVDSVSQPEEVQVSVEVKTPNNSTNHPQPATTAPVAEPEPHQPEIKEQNHESSNRITDWQDISNAIGGADGGQNHSAGHTVSLGLLMYSLGRALGGNKLRLVTVCALVCIIAFGVFVTVQSFMINQEIEQIQSGTVQGTSTPADTSGGGTGGVNETDESKPDSQSYAVAARMPRFFSSEALAVSKSRILPMGVDGQNQLMAPINVHDVGWYNNSVLPGSGAGAVVLDAHVSGPTIPGAFKNLSKLNKGDTVSIELGDGTVIDYEVHSSEQVPYRELDMSKALSPVVSGTESLTMITCGGEYDSATEEYLSRDVVYAVRVN